MTLENVLLVIAIIVAIAHPFIDRRLRQSDKKKEIFETLSDKERYKQRIDEDIKVAEQSFVAYTVFMLSCLSILLISSIERISNSTSLIFHPVIHYILVSASFLSLLIFAIFGLRRRLTRQRLSEEIHKLYSND